MTRLEKTVKGLELLKQRLILQADVLGYGYHIDDIDNALEMLKAKDINATTKWVSVKDRLPEVRDSYIVAGKQRYKGEPWEYFTDVAASHGSYIDDFWDTFNDWKEGQETHVTHWMPLPEPPKEGD